MALVNSVKAIEHLFPAPNDKPFESMITTTPQNILYRSTICGILVDSKENKVLRVYRISFSIFSSPRGSFLFIKDANKDLTTLTPFIKAKNKEGEPVKSEDWPFENDEIGLHVKIGFDKDKTIYFATSALDTKRVKEALRNRVEKKTLILEPVYV